MFDFDERDLLEFASAAGFDDLRLDYRASISDAPALSGRLPEWETLLKSSGNPNIPTLEEALDEALSPSEKERFVAHLRPRVEAGDRRGREAVAYLTARKGAA